MFARSLGTMARLAHRGSVPRALRARAFRNRPDQARGGQGDAGGAVPAPVGLLPAGPPAAPSGGRAAEAHAPDQGWCEDPSSPRYNRPLRLPAPECADRMWRDDHLYDLTFVIDQNFSRRAKGRGSAIFFISPVPALPLPPVASRFPPPTCASSAPRLARGAIDGDRLGLSFPAGAKRPTGMESAAGKQLWIPGRTFRFAEE